ncbi:hypothetical protein BDZ89DRAFT_1257565 [Hymenopellis radicata]|nr:hypothetical protein BDZ89DRAFT_1257565 [Hymenopellis radicata]
MAANQLNHGPTGQPRPRPNSQQMQMIMSFADQPVEQLRANGVSEGIISFIETNRAHLQRTAMEQTSFRTCSNGMSNGIPPNRPFSASPPQNSNPMMHPNQAARNQPFVLGGMSNAVHDGTNQEHRPAINPQQSKVMMQQFVRSNSEQLQRVTSMLNTMKNDFIQNRMHNLPPVPVPPEQRMEYNNVVEQLYRSAADLDAKLPMLFLFLKNEAWIRKVAIIIVTVQQQRQFLSSSNPRFIVSLDNLRHMLAEVQKAHEVFNNTMQMGANRNMNAAARAQMQSQQPPSLQQISTPQPHPSIPQQPIRAPPPANTSAPPPPQAATARLSRKPSAQPGGAASPTPPPISATTPTANAPTLSAAINAASSPKFPKAKTKAKPPAKSNRRPSKVLSTPNPGPATLPAPSPSNSNKRSREEDAPPATGPGATPPFMNSVANEPSPLKKAEDRLGRTFERYAQAAKMTELIKMAGGEGQEALSSDISDTLDIILKGYRAVPDGSTSLGEGRSRAATPDLVSSSSTNSSPESGSEVDTPHAHTFSDLKTEEPADPLRLSTTKEVDGGESAYYQSTAWKWDGSPMPRAD